MNTRSIRTVLLLTLLLCAMVGFAQDQWPDPALPWVGLGCGVAAGIAVDSLIYVFQDDPITVVPAAAIGMASSVATTMLFFRYVGHENILWSAGMGTAGAAAAGFVSVGIAWFAADLIDNIQHRVNDPATAENLSISTSVLFAGLTAVPAAAIGLIAGVVLSLTVYAAP